MIAKSTAEHMASLITDVLRKHNIDIDDRSQPILTAIITAVKADSRAGIEEARSEMTKRGLACADGKIKSLLRSARFLCGFAQGG